jgi:hypothetical protein
MLLVLITVATIAGCCSPALSETLNSFRRAQGLPALQRSGALQAMAHSHARSMAARGTMDHSGFYTERGRAGARAENVAAGCASENWRATIALSGLPRDAGEQPLKDTAAYVLLTPKDSLSFIGVCIWRPPPVTKRKPREKRKPLSSVMRPLDPNDPRSIDHPRQQKRIAQVFGRMAADMIWDAHHAAKKRKPETENWVQLELFQKRRS